MYPGEELTESKHWKLLDANHGPLSKEEFYKNSHYYVRSSNFVTIPAKVEYYMLRN